MRILIIDRQPPLDLRQGNALIGRHIFPLLARRHDLTLVCPVQPGDEEWASAQLREWFTDVHLVPRPKHVAALKGYIEASVGDYLPTPLQPSGARWATTFSHTLQAVTATTAFDVVHTRELPMAAFLRRLRAVPTVLEFIDSAALREQRRRDIATPTSWPRAPIARSIERRAMRACDIATAVSPADAAALRTLAPETDVRIVRNGVDTDYFRPANVQEEPERILFAGAMSYPPNVAAVDFFYRAVWPQVRRRFPLARFVVCGRDPAPEIRALAGDPSVVVTGAVDDMRTWYSRAAVVVCPMTTGSGIKNKVLEALAMERAVVASPLAVEALDVRDNVEVRIADSPTAFAEHCCALMVDREERLRLGRAGRAYVEREHSWEGCAAAYDA
ncbi:MAG: hypothetical protein DCC58_16755, partial [Chloroflexi bacterium]